MLRRKRNALASFLALVALAAAASASTAQELYFEIQKRGGERGGPNSPPTEEPDPPPAATPTLQEWMSPDLLAAWIDGYLGQGTRITVIDDFSSPWGYYGDLGLGLQLLRHGEWTSLEAGLIAPSASIVERDFNGGSRVKLAGGLNILNLSYGMFTSAGYNLNQIRWGNQEASIISYAGNGDAVISKAAGNDGIAVGGVNSQGNQDYLNLALIGTQSAIFVGALDANGVPGFGTGTLASYSNFAGPDPEVQSHFLVVGVEGSLTGLYGTSFAAPIVAGYAAIVGSKFLDATPTQIVNQLLSTARQDTLLNFTPGIFGQGEACLSCALAPITIH